MRPFAAACLAACAFVSVHAATPTVVWEGDFNVTSKTGSDGLTYTFDAQGNNVADGILTIDQSVGATITPSSANQGKCSVLIKYSNLAAKSGAKPTLATIRSNSGFDIGLAPHTAGGLEMNGFYNNDANRYGFGENAGNSNTDTLTTLAGGAGYFLFTQNKDAGTTGFSGTTIADMTSGGKSTKLKWKNNNLSTISIGGPREARASYPAWTGARIEKVAVFYGSELTADDLKDFLWPSEMPFYGYHYNGDGTAYTPANFTAASTGNFVDGFTDKAMYVNGSGSYGGGFNIGDNDFTVVFVAKSANTVNKIFYGFGNGYNKGFGFVSNGSSGIKFVNWNNGTGIIEQSLNVAAGANATADYHTYVVKYVKSETKAYYSVDGSDYVQIGTAMQWEGSPNWQIGSFHSKTYGNFGSGDAGAIDELRFYQSCLDIADVREIAAEYLPSRTYTATIPAGDVAFADIVWNKPWQNGNTVRAEITLQGNTTLALDENYVGGKLVVKSVAGQKLKLNTAGCAFGRIDLTDAAGKVEIAGVNWNDLAQNAVAGTPFSHWLNAAIDGSGNLDLPDVPFGYNVALDIVASYDSRFVITAPDTAKYGSVNINFAGGRDTHNPRAHYATACVSDNAAYMNLNHGAQPIVGTLWTDLDASNGTYTVTKVVDSAGAATEGSVTVTATGVNNAYDLGTGTCGDQIIYGYDDDGGNPTFTISGIPFTRFRVIVYRSTDSDNMQYCAVEIGATSSNTKFYYGPTTTAAGGYTVAGAVAQVWGNTSKRDAIVEGANYVVSDVIEGGNVYIKNTKSGGRAGVAAIQIVKLGEVVSSEYCATVTGNANFSALQWTPARPATFVGVGTVIITNVATSATLTLDEDIDAMQLKVVSAAGKALMVAPNDVDTTFGAVDLSKAAGRAELGFDTGAAAVVAGVDTIVRGGGTGALTVGENRVATIKDGLWAGTKTCDATATVRYAGTTALPTLPDQAAAECNATVAYAAPVAQQDYIGFNGNNLKRIFEEGLSLSVVTNHFGNGSSVTQSFTQVGGAITVIGSNPPINNSAAVLFAHWKGRVDYKMEGGTYTAENAAIRFGWDGEIHFAQSGGTLRTKGIKSGGERNNAASFTMNGGTLELGDFGIQALGSAASYTLNGGTVRAYGNATITVSNTDGLKIAGAVTFEAASGKTLFVKSDNVVEGGSITVGGAGTVVFRNYREAVTLAGTAKVGYTVGINDLGRFKIPSGMSADDIRLYDTTGAEVPYTVDGDTLVFEWKITGDACWWDYEFDEAGTTGTDGPINGGTEGTRMKFDGDRPATVKGKEYVTNVVETVTNILLRVPSRPWRDVSSWPAVATYMFYGTMVGSNMTYQLSFGSKNGNGNQLFIATRNVSEGTVDLCFSVNGAAPTVLCTMNVPNAQSSNHLYAFVLKDDGNGNSVVNTYLDGELLQPYVHSGKLTLGGGFQIASGHGGVVEGYGRPADNDPALIDWLRVYDTELSSNAMSRLAVLYPYESNNGKATRTIGADGAWRQEGAWTQWSPEGVAATQDAPDSNTVVAVTMTSDATIEMNLDSLARYEQFTVDGTGKLVLTQGTGAVAPIVVGRSAIKTDMTVSYECFHFGGNVDIADGKTLTFDFASLDLGTYFFSTTIKLTGMATLGAGANVEAANLAQVAYRTAALIRDDATGQYQLVITVEDHPFVYTIGAGAQTGTWTWNGAEVSAETVAANPAVLISKEGDGTYETDINRAFEVRAGTLKAASYSGAPTITICGGSFDVNGKADSAHVVLAGGKLLNDGADISTQIKQFSSIRQTAASRIGGTKEFGYITSQWGANTLDLGGATLTKEDTNTFSLCNCTVTNGTLVVAGGTLRMSERSVYFANASLEIGAAGTLEVQKALTNGTVKAEKGAKIVNAGFVGPFALKGSLALEGNGAYGTITLSSAVVEVGTRRGLSLGGAGSVDVELTDAELGGTGQIILFVPAQGAAVTLGIVRNSTGDDITDQCTLKGGTLTIGQEARIGETKYLKLADALAVVEKDQTVVMLRDVLLTGVIPRACTLDVAGKSLAASNVTITATGNLLMADSSDGSGHVEILKSLTISGGSSCRLMISAMVTTDGGSLVVEDGVLAVGNDGAAILDGVSVQIGSKGVLDLSSGTSLSCRNFTSKDGRVVGASATLIVDGMFDASASTQVAKLRLPYGAKLKGTGLRVSSLLELQEFLVVEADEEQVKQQLATVPEGSEYSTSVELNGKEGYVIRRSGTSLRVVKDDVVTAHVAVDVVSGTNFESLHVEGQVDDWGGSGQAHGHTNVYVVAVSESTGAAVTQKVDYVAGSAAGGTFQTEIEGVDAGDTYTVSAFVHIDGGETEAKSRRADVVAARSIERTPDGSDGWIYEDAETFAGVKPGTGYWYGTNDLACVDNGVISLFAEDWTRTAEFQPTNMTLDLEYSYVKDLHFHLMFDCPGFYSYESYPIVQDGVSAAFTLVADDEDNCSFAVVSGGGWKIISRDVFKPKLDVPYDVLVRLDGVASNIQYSVISDDGVTRLATCPVVNSKDISLDLAGSGDVELIEGVGQNAHLAQVDDEQYWTIGKAIEASGNTGGAVVPLWWSRYVVDGDGGAFRLKDPNGYLELIWRKWHHWGVEDDVYRWISGNNWIEYADEAGVVKDANGALLVTNEFGLAWIAEQATNQWFCGDVSVSTNLDLSSKNWTPIAQFMGSFDGRGYTIKGLNNSHVIYTNLLGAAGYYFGAPTSDWDYTAYGLFGSATNASFANVTFEDVAISNVADSAAVLLGVHAGGTLAISNVTVASGRVQGEGRAVAGIVTVGGDGESVGDIVVANVTNRAAIAGAIFNDADGGNVAQILAGTTWGTVFEGEVVVTNVVAEGAFDVSVTDGMATDGWHDSYFSWFDLPVCNFAAAVMRFTEEDGFRRFVEANDPASVPIDPVYRTARMLAGSFANGADNVAGWWMDTITAMTNGGNLWITGELVTNDTWQTVTVDRSVSFDLRGNTICTVYDDTTFRVTHDACLSITNGTILVPEGGQAFGCVGASSVESNDVNIVYVPGSFYDRTVIVDNDTFATMDMFLGMLNYLPSGTTIEMDADTGLVVDPESDSVIYEGKRIAMLSGCRSIAPASSSDGTVTYVLELNDKAVPDFGLEVKSAAAPDGTVAISLSGTRAGFYYAVQHKSSLVEKDWTDASEWKYVETDGAPVSFALPAEDAAGFYRVKVTDRNPVEN